MRRLSLALTLLASLAPIRSFADTYSFTISTGASTSGSPGTTFLASGTLTGTAASSTTLTLTDVTGSAQGYAFAGVVPVGAVSAFAYDDLLYTDPSAVHVDASGILLDLNSPVGLSLAHVYDTAAGYRVDVYDPNDLADGTPFSISTFTLTPSAVPEPSTLALLGTGALGLFGVARRRLSR